MKKLYLILIIALISCNIFSQNIGDHKQTFVFFDECTNKIINPEYEITLIKDSKNKAILFYSFLRNEMISQNTVTIDLDKAKDTIRIPKILFATGQELHSKKWYYRECENICNGKLIEYYENGEKKIEGLFVEGKPAEIKFYYQNGILEKAEFYVLGTLDLQVVYYFDEKGNLIQYKDFFYKRRKVIIRTFDKNHKLILEEKKKGKFPPKIKDIA